MHKHCLLIFLLSFVMILTACQPIIKAASTPLVSKAEKGMPETPVPSIVTVTQTDVLTGLAPTPAIGITGLLKIFPLHTGAYWSYIETNYTQAGSDPNTILKAVVQIDERIIDIQKAPPYYFVHVRRSTTLIKVDSGYPNNDLENFGLGDFDYWYIVLNGRVYRSTDQPDLSKIQLDQLDEEFIFPMTVGLSWCPNKRQRGNLTPVVETPVPCASAGSRTVLEERSYQTKVGSYDHCYRLGDAYNDGSLIQWLCEGVGVVAQEYHHVGTQFGFTYELVKFTPGYLP